MSSCWGTIAGAAQLRVALGQPARRNLRADHAGGFQRGLHRRVKPIDPAQNQLLERIRQVERQLLALHSIRNLNIGDQLFEIERVALRARDQARDHVIGWIWWPEALVPAGFDQGSRIQIRQFAQWHDCARGQADPARPAGHPHPRADVPPATAATGKIDDTAPDQLQQLA